MVAINTSKQVHGGTGRLQQRDQSRWQAGARWHWQVSTKGSVKVAGRCMVALAGCSKGVKVAGRCMVALAGCSKGFKVAGRCKVALAGFDKGVGQGSRQVHGGIGRLQQRGQSRWQA
eukprot:57123-Pelagomonas_calceolata.AAC.1